MIKPITILGTTLTLALTGCSGEAEERSYEVRAEDEGGGELIATPADAEGVDVELPETEMTPVPPIMEGEEDPEDVDTES